MNYLLAAKDITKSGSVDLRELFKVIPEILEETDIDGDGESKFNEQDLCQRLEVLRGEIESQLKGRK